VWLRLCQRANGSSVLDRWHEIEAIKRRRRRRGSTYAFEKAEKQRSVCVFLSKFDSSFFQLKKKWEEDKAKVEKPKVSPRFKPY
jgi:hypothetical protein